MTVSITRFCIVCHYVECDILFIVMLSIIMFNVVALFRNPNLVKITLG